MFAIGGPQAYGGMQPMGPGAQIGQELQSMAESGEISSEDKVALQSAVYEIGNELHSSRPESGSTPPTGDEISEKIDSLISEQVEAGTLTEEQAETLSDVFESVQAAAPQGGPPPGGPGGPGAGGPPPSGSNSEESDTNAMLEQFLQNLQEQSATSYASSGSVSGESSFLFNYSA
ncbi:hypothetical protein [Cohaesibacter intestini]|uniref:hypothetical protein n=1 Tax=Cohaesibacter intestini TaxID=2211145 RepID=UPI001FDF0F85|nr:hypothetical protein [Cohaesibacter intestini]